MRLPIILMLLVVLLLPADLRGFASDVEAQAQNVAAMVGNFLERNDKVQVAEVPAASRTVTR